MSTANIIHLTNILIDWARKQPRTQPNTQLIHALRHLRDVAVAKIKDETGNDSNA